jgi:hypothetical protein
MSTLRAIRCSRNVRQRFCCGVVLAAYLATIFGFPLPATGRPGDSTTAPCRGKACDCQTEAMCQGGCCCSTVQQSADDSSDAVVCDTDAQDPSHSCCSSKSVSIAGRAVPAKPSKKSPANRDHGLRWVVGVTALRCQGQSTLWVTSGAVTVAAPPLRLDTRPIDPAGHVPEFESSALRIPIQPIDRPPRFTAISIS